MKSLIALLCLFPFMVQAQIACPTKETRDKGFKITYDSGSTLEVVSYNQNILNYISILPNLSGLTRNSTAFGLIFLSVYRDKPFYSALYDYHKAIPTDLILTSGVTFSYMASVHSINNLKKNETYNVAYQFTIGDELTYKVGECSYKIIKIIRESLSNATRSQLTLYYVPDLMISLASFIKSFNKEGNVANETTFIATSIKLNP